MVWPALAKDVDGPERTARAACLAGDYATGAKILSELFVDTKDPVYIFDQGRCFEQNRRYDDAIARFQEYLRAGKNLRKADKADAQKHIAECQALLAPKTVAQPSAEPADRADDKETKERAAKKACLTEDPVAGVALLTDLFIDTNDPTYLFNQGRCFEQNLRYQEAIGRFREYLVKAKNLSPEAKADTDKHIADCESYLHKQQAEPAKAPAQVVATETTRGGENKAAEIRAKESNVAAEVAPPLPSANARQAGGGLRMAGVAVAGLGGAGLVTGLVLNLRFNSMTGDLQSDWDPALSSKRDSYKTGAWIAYGAGAACVVGGALLYYLGWRRDESATSVAVVPTVGPEMAGTSVVGAF